MTDRAGQIGQLVRTMAAQLRDAVTGALGLAAHDLPAPRPHRVLVVEKIGRNAVAELVNQARNHPQRGDSGSANPAYIALAELAANHGLEGLALGLKHETGEISFLDLDQSPEAAAITGGPFVSRELNKSLWRQLKKLVNIVVDRNMLGPRLPIRSPEEIPDEPELSDEAERLAAARLAVAELEAAKLAAAEIEAAKRLDEENAAIEAVLKEAAEAEENEPETIEPAKSEPEQVEPERIESEKIEAVKNEPDRIASEESGAENAGPETPGSQTP